MGDKHDLSEMECGDDFGKEVRAQWCLGEEQSKWESSAHGVQSRGHWPRSCQEASMPGL